MILTSMMISAAFTLVFTGGNLCLPDCGHSFISKEMRYESASSGPVQSVTNDSTFVIAVNVSPSNKLMTVSYTLPERNMISLTVYDVFERRVNGPLVTYRSKGNQRNVLNISSLRPGIYFVVMIAGNHVGKKMVEIMK